LVDWTTVLYCACRPVVASAVLVQPVAR